MGKKFFFWPLENVFFLVRQNYTTPQNLRAQLSNWKIGADTLLKDPREDKKILSELSKVLLVN